MTNGQHVTTALRSVIMLMLITWCVVPHSSVQSAPFRHFAMRVVDVLPEYIHTLIIIGKHIVPVLLSLHPKSVVPYNSEAP